MDREIENIKLNKKQIYFNEIVDPQEFKEIYLCENVISIFSTKVTTKSARSFATYLAKDRKSLNIDKGDILLLRAIKENKEFEFVAKIYKWGRFYIRRKIIKTINIKNHEKIRFEIINKAQKLKNRDNNEIDLANIINQNVQIIPRKNNFITIYSKRRIPITIPRFIKINPKLLELFFLIHGDGHYKTKLFFVNKSPELIKFVMEQFEDILKIPKNEWRGRIILTNLEKQKQVRKYWENKLDLKDEQFYSTSESKFNTSKYGNLRIIIDKTIVAFIFRFIFNELKPRLDKDNSFYALNGLLCAEGGAQIGKVGLHKLTLSFNKEEKSLFEDILNKTALLKICKIEQNRNYVIEKWKNHYFFFKKFLEKDVIPFRYHNKRRKNAFNGFLNHSFTKTIIKYLSILDKKNNITLKQFSDLLGIREDSILDTIRKNQYGDFIRINGKGRRNNPFIISIIKEGKLFLNMINKIRRNVYEPRFTSF